MRKDWMRWTTERPTEPGYYWAGVQTEEAVAVFVVEVFQEEHVLRVHGPGGKEHPLSLFQCWAEPIPPPEGELVTGLSDLNALH